MNSRELTAEIVRSGTWLYDNQIPMDVWIIKQNFEYHYEIGYDDGPERLNPNGETYQVVFVRSDQRIIGTDRLSLEEAVQAAEEVVKPIDWTNHIQQKLFGGRWYSTEPIRDA